MITRTVVKRSGFTTWTWLEFGAFLLLTWLSGYLVASPTFQ